METKTAQRSATKIISLGPGSALWEKGEKNRSWRKEIGELSEPRGSLGMGKGGGAWRHAFDA